MATQASDATNALLVERIGWIVKPLPNVGQVTADPACACYRLLGCVEHQARVAGHAIVNDERLNAAAVEDGCHPALHGRRQTAFRVCQWHIHLFRASAILDKMAV